MPGPARLQLGRLVVTPLVTIGVLAAVLVWEIEHVGSIVLAVAIAAGGVTVGIVVARRLREDMERLADHYEALLKAADDASRRAESANRAKDEFLATISHELRTPLNSILGWTHLLATGKLGASQTTHAIQAIERAGWSQSRMIEGLLDLSRIISGKLEISTRPTLVESAVEAAVSALRPAAEAKRIALTTALDRSLGQISVDPDRMHQVVWHLVSNAIKFTPGGGTVTVTLTVGDGELRIAVRDTGIGFDAEVASHLFERLRQGDSSPTREYGGLGLGLAIVRHIVELHGGTVSASSSGKLTGSVFEVRLPIRRVDTSSVQTVEQPSHPLSLSGVSVLVVDDEPQVLDVERNALEASGAKVATATSAREARDRFARERPDVIVSDVLMPEEDGLQLIRSIRRSEDPMRRTPAAAVSALVRSEDRSRALSAGYQMHLAKPIDPAELVATVERLAKAQRGPKEVVH